MTAEKSGDLSSGLLPSPTIPGKRMGVDEMLSRFAGEFGPWQLRQFTVASFAWSLNAFHTMIVVFADRQPEWRCTGGVDCPPTMCGLRPEEWEWMGGSNSSTVAEWGLVCGQKYKVGLAQSLFFAGSMIGAGMFGHLSDSHLGRKRTLIISTTLTAAFGLLTALAPSFPFYALLRLLTGLGTGGVGLSAFLLATEPLGPTARPVAAMSVFYFFSAATAALSAASILTQSWRRLYFAASLPSLLFPLLLAPFLAESPRWLLLHHRNSPEALDLIKSIAASNGTHVPDWASLALDSDDQRTGGSIADAVKSPVARIRLVLAVLINLVSSISYYGLSLNVSNLSTEIHVSVILNAVAEVPAYAMTALAVRSWGRRPLTAGATWFGAAFCALAGFFSGGLRTGFGMVGIFAATATFDLMFIYTAELFPTALRNAALGCVTQAGQAGAVVAPLVVVLGGIWPFVVFTVCGVVGGVLAGWLPETMDRPFYDTLAGMESGEVVKGEVKEGVSFGS